MSRERARRRAEREREAAIRRAARAAELERHERRTARRQALRRVVPLPRTVTGRVTRGLGRGRPTGILARRRRRQHLELALLLLLLNVAIWVLRPDWESRLAAALVTVLVAPVLATLLFDRR
ncbi:MAG TPA: hypothetical protein VFG88_04255 [Nocardioidaceae bacterium]|nr:hypothetical protein [Nocardioidaceae bacterium]